MPDLDVFLGEFPGLPPADLVQLVCIDQAERWRRGQFLRAEDYLARYSSLARDEEASLDLIYSEFVLRQQSGEAPRPEAFASRFPAHADRLNRLLQLDQFLVGDSVGVQSHSTLDSGPEASETNPVPSLIGKYRVIGLLGQGAQAQVYRAVHPTLGQDVVVKLARKPAGPALREPLLAEGRVLASLEHPGLARVHDLDFHEERAFLVMEYVRGVSLEQHVRDAHLSPREASLLVARLARALALAHARGVLHLDIKPANILMGEDGQPRLIDFGLARMTDVWGTTGNDGEGLSGTVPYMSPEQARADREQIGPRSDLFALGGVLYFLLTGKPPFDGKSMSVALEQARRCAWDHTALTHLPRRLRAVCERVLTADPARRHPDANAFAADLERCAAPRRRMLWPALALLLAAIVGGAGYLVASWWQPGSVAAVPVVEDAFARDVKKRLWVQIWAEGRFRSVENVLEVRGGDRVRITLDAPANLHLGLFVFGSTGELTLLCQWEPRPQQGTLGYPADVKRYERLGGPPGTEVVLVCGRPDGPVELADVQAWWDARTPWPALSAGTVVRMQRARVVFDCKGRPLVAGGQMENPEGEVEERLEKKRLGRPEWMTYCEAVAFAHGK